MYCSRDSITALCSSRTTQVRRAANYKTIQWHRFVFLGTFLLDRCASSVRSKESPSRKATSTSVLDRAEVRPALGRPIRARFSLIGQFLNLVGLMPRNVLRALMFPDHLIGVVFEYCRARSSFGRVSPHGFMIDFGIPLTPHSRRDGASNDSALEVHALRRVFCSLLDRSFHWVTSSFRVNQLSRLRQHLHDLFGQQVDVIEVVHVEDLEVHAGSTGFGKRCDFVQHLSR